jgi:hypothetical protein
MLVVPEIGGRSWELSGHPQPGSPLSWDLLGSRSSSKKAAAWGSNYQSTTQAGRQSPPCPTVTASPSLFPPPHSCLCPTTSSSPHHLSPGCPAQLFFKIRVYYLYKGVSL